MKKSHTPSLGGVGILVMLWVSLFFVDLTFDIVWLVCLFSGFAFIGLYDDLSSLFKRKNQGLRTLQKFFLQVILALVFLFWFHVEHSVLSVVDWGICLFALVGTSNATNLTDGLDGLLGGLSLITLLGFLFFSSLVLNGSLVIVLLLLMMNLLGFLVFNRNPAKIFMGDTGSLALGAFFVGVAMVLGNIWLLLPLGAVYILETLSVMVQVGYYKITKNRIFLMAPLHHHFELLGFKEVIVVRLFWFIGLIFCLFFII